MRFPLSSQGVIKTLNKQNKKISLANIINYMVSILLVSSLIFCVQVMWQVSQQGYVSILDTSVFRVVTGSMEPTLPVGTIILSRETSIEEIQEEDIICFRSLQDYLDDAIITHRVVAIDQNEAGEIELFTKGDANTVTDGYLVTSENLVGKLIWNSEEDDIVSSVMGGVSNPMGLISLIILPCMLVSSWVMGDAVKSIRKELAHLKELERAQAENIPSAVQPEETYEEMERRIYQELMKELIEDAATGETEN